MTEPKASWTEVELNSDNVSKKDLVQYLQENASIHFQQEHKLKGQLKSIAKTKSKDALIAAYKAMWEEKAFKAEGEDEAAEAEAKANAETKAVEAVTQQTDSLKVSDLHEGPPKYKKVTMKKGDKTNYAKKGDMVLCYYSGKLPDGTVFDQNLTGGKRGNRKPQPLKFKVGQGLVIRGWDEALLTMCINEKAEITIEPEWAYGRRGVEGKVPPNATLIFEVELVGIE